MALTPFGSDPFFGGLLTSTPLSLTRWPDEFSTLFEHGPIRSFVRDTQAVANTAVDVKETPTEYKFMADLPGLKRDEVKVQIEDGNVLNISGERTREEKQETDTFHRVERSTGKFLRRFRLPQNADASKVEAAVQHGVLTVTVPKIQPKEEEKPAPVTVQVKEG